MTSKHINEKKIPYKLFLILKEGISDKEISDHLSNNIQKYKIKMRREVSSGCVCNLHIGNTTTRTSSMKETQTIKPHKADHQSFLPSAWEPGPKEACPPPLLCQLLKRPEKQGNGKIQPPFQASIPKRWPLRKPMEPRPELPHLGNEVLKINNSYNKLTNK